MPYYDTVPGVPVPKISVRHLNFFYGKTQALFDNNLDIATRKVTAIIGPSGCGKSTHLRVYNRIYELYPDHYADGQVQVDGLEVLNPQTNVMDLRKKVGMVFQRAIPFPMSIFDNVAFGLRQHYRFNKQETAERVEKALHGAAIWDEVKDHLDRPGTSLSGGQQQRLCIARAIVVEPEVLLMDEPCSAIDPLSTNKIEALIHELKFRYTIVIVTHNMAQALRVSDYTAFFFEGHIIDFGATADIFNRHSLLDEVPPKEKLKELLDNKPKFESLS
ncbi:MAG: phosphate ABC transporter ATP-binding protein [Thermodesulfobacteriota bacterium]